MATIENKNAVCALAPSCWNIKCFPPPEFSSQVASSVAVHFNIARHSPWCLD